jgi:hypothetical protein
MLLQAGCKCTLRVLSTVLPELAVAFRGNNTIITLRRMPAIDTGIDSQVLDDREHVRGWLRCSPQNLARQRSL